MNVTRISDQFATTAQLRQEDMPELARAGFRSVVNNRPDYEGGAEQPAGASLREAANAAGLAYAHLPVSPSRLTEDEVERFSGLLDSLPKPIVGFCRTGTRSRKLHEAAQHLKRPPAPARHAPR